MRPTRLFSKVREIVHLFGLVPIALLLIILVLVGVFLRLSGVWDIWPTRYTSITITGNHTCGILTNGTLRCWGEMSRRPPPDERFVAVAPGYGHACGLREDGSISCWGAIDDDYSPDPAPEASSEPFTSITAGFSHYCGLPADGSVVCWGSNYDGRASPPDGEQFRAISAGHSDTCGLRMDGTAVCWGKYLNGLQTCSAPPDGTARCWGRRLMPGQESSPEDERFKAISVGTGFACAIHLDDDITCWGEIDRIGGWKWSERWQNGERIRVERADGPMQRHIAGQFIALSSGDDHACALRSNGEVYCWGKSYSCCGLTLFGRSSDYGDDLVSGEEFVSISSGRHYNCALRRTGTARCWGGGNVNRIRPSE